MGKFLREDKVKTKDFSRKNVVFISWDKLSEICSEFLSNRVQRKIGAWATCDDPYLREWYLLLCRKSRLAHEEIDCVLNSIKADDNIRDANSFGEYPVGELSSGLAIQLLNLDLNMSFEGSLPEDEGVWFFEKENDSTYLKTVG